jgi:hypothetical protein
MSKKKYWFQMCFLYSTATGHAYSAQSFGFPEHKITVPRIDWAKKELKIPDSAIMTSCSYLGRMTTEEIQG